MGVYPDKPLHHPTKVVASIPPPRYVKIDICLGEHHDLYKWDKIPPVFSLRS